MIDFVFELVLVKGFLFAFSERRLMIVHGCASLHEMGNIFFVLLVFHFIF